MSGGVHMRYSCIILEANKHIYKQCSFYHVLRHALACKIK
jgi:hypothetical protein